MFHVSQGSSNHPVPEGFNPPTLIKVIVLLRFPEPHRACAGLEALSLCSSEI